MWYCVIRNLGLRKEKCTVLLVPHQSSHFFLISLEYFLFSFLVQFNIVFMSYRCVLGIIVPLNGCIILMWLICLYDVQPSFASSSKSVDGKRPGNCRRRWWCGLGGRKVDGRHPRGHDKVIASHSIFRQKWGTEQSSASAQRYCVASCYDLCLTWPTLLCEMTLLLWTDLTALTSVWPDPVSHLFRLTCRDASMLSQHCECVQTARWWLFLFDSLMSCLWSYTY